MPTTSTETVTAHDGGTFAATAVLPDNGTATGAGVLLFQEIFGVNDFLLSKADDLAALGYVVLCPDVFWRIEPGVWLPHDEAALQQAFGYVQRWGAEVADEDKVADLGAAFDHLHSMPEVTGPVAVMGYCLGGMLAYRTASAFAADACVSYYGSGIGGLLAAGEQPTCPTIFHFGGSDPFILEEEVDAIREGLGGRADVELHVQPGAGHAFENFLAEQFSDPQATAVSWPLTVSFLERTLKV
jgi:carboxymethylenebutenolidase